MLKRFRIANRAETCESQSLKRFNIGGTAHFEGIILSQTAITLRTGASMNGRLLAASVGNVRGTVVGAPSLAQGGE